MCGILGYWGNIDEGSFDEAFQALAHRGPDGSGKFQFHRLRLGHHRLAIQDLSEHASQPMHSPSGRFVISFNGEIYNHVELRKSKLAEIAFNTGSDTETILAGWEKYGPEWIRQLNGMFAFALLDKVENTLYLARDPNGIKPLFYFKESEGFGFASEMPALLKLWKGPQSLSPEALRNYLLFLFAPGGQTPFRHIHALPPGSMLALPLEGNTAKAAPMSFVAPLPYSPKNAASPSKLVKQFRETFFSAVNRQLISDVPLAFLLSGGLDSSAILAAVRTLYPNRPLTAFTLKSMSLQDSEGLADDLHYARQVAKQLNVTLVEVEADIDPQASFDAMVKTLGLPLADAAALHLDILCTAAAKQGFKVLIGGWGGDELLSGYRRHQMLGYSWAYRLLGPLTGLTHRVGNRIPTNSLLLRRLKKVLLSIGPTKRKSLQNLFTWLPESEVTELFAKKSHPEIFQSPFVFFDLLDQQLPQKLGDLDRMLQWDWATYLVDNNLHYADAMSMKHGVEIRVPFLDHELVAFARTMPERFKMRGQTTKYMLRIAMKEYLTHEVIYRPKTGFGGPVRQWIKEAMHEKMNDYLGEEQLKAREIFNFAAIQKLIKHNADGKEDASYTLWALLAMESWMQQFMDQSMKETIRP
jgi:asparagine synthase (glutamine-hydrolysing)